MIAVTAAVALAGCDRGERDPAQPPQPDGEPASSAEPKSIFRPEFQAEPAPEPEPLAPLERRVLFPEGAGLTPEALAALAEIVASPQYEAGGPIVLRGHSDAGGNDEANLRMSEARAEAVRDWMIENGASEERITVIAFGEQNPVAPNAKPDGTPNEKGRALNRRVDIAIAVAAPPPPIEDPTLAETLAEPADEAEFGTNTEKSAREE